jgi:hypothetical protein
MIRAKFSICVNLAIAEKGCGGEEENKIMG